MILNGHKASAVPGKKFREDRSRRIVVMKPQRSFGQTRLAFI